MGNCQRYTAERRSATHGISFAKERIMSVATLERLASPAVKSADAVVSCYDVLDVGRGCGITDFTDGKYVDDRNDRHAYLEAQKRQADYLLDQVDCGRGSRILDIGCGY